ncbi:aromatic compound dioxygenase [Patellaria atrata CBS 101060]|uniref:Aromatic compound dioxygenase n=1 Tax=Patellaria atrata CBS 101060 TaxID=1346257 RepID=A0A9P4SJN1_9PEZI|nr:aromatic compound dioxygenase [Patellaria atrata CBS 101060]
MQLLKVVLCAALTGGVVAHPGADIHAEVQKRAEHLANPSRRTLADCTRELHESGYYKHRLARRLERANALRAELGHAPSADENLLPRGPLEERQRAACVTDPEVTEGPYWVSGELIRSDVLEGTQGVKLNLDINVIDVSTCKPIPNIYVELWGCNSTGVYTGVVAKTNGVGLAAPQEINNSALRGLQATSANGTASFITVVPGHYTGRPNHLHTIIHHGATKLPNNTIQGGTISHVGQFYFDQNLLSSVEKTAPYNTNTQALTLNSQDQLFKQGQGGGDNPVVQITQLGNTVESGLYGFIDVGVNPTARRNPSPVNFWTANGGMPNRASFWQGYPWTKKIREVIGI